MCDIVSNMKTTIDIAEPLLLKAKSVALKKRVTLRQVVEEGLRLFLADSQKEPALPEKSFDFPAKGGGFTSEFEGAGWEKIRHEIYKGRGE